MWYPALAISASFVACALVTWYTLFHFTRKDKQSFTPAIYLFLWLTYFINFCSLALITVDISMGSFFRAKEGDPNTIQTYMVVLWKLIYWSIQVLSWIFIPLCQSYVLRGEFSAAERIWASVVENVLLYGVMFAVLGIVGGFAIGYLIYHGQKFTLDSLVGLALSASNAFGLVLLTLLLGYGFVYLPKRLWQRANYRLTLSSYYHEIAKLQERLEDTEDQLELIMKRVYKLETEKNKVEYSELTDHMEQIFRTAHTEPIYQQVKQAAARKSLRTSERKDAKQHLHDEREEEEQLLDYKALVQLHYGMLTSIRAHHKIEYQFQYVQKRAMFMEDVIESEKYESSRYRAMTIRYPVPASSMWKLLYFCEWFYYTRIHRWIMRTTALMVIIFSIVLLWCELATPILRFTGINVSLFYWGILAIDMLKMRLLLQLYSLVLIILVSVIIYYALFDIQIFDWYQLIPHHSDSVSMLFLAMIFCRVIPTLCFNVLQLFGITAHNQVAFFQVMGVLRLEELKLLGTIASLFVEFFPLVIPCFTFLFAFNVCGRLAMWLGLTSAQTFDPTDGNTESLILSSKEWLKMARIKQASGQFKQEEPQQQHSDDDEESDISETSRMIQPNTNL